MSYESPSFYREDAHFGKHRVERFHEPPREFPSEYLYDSLLDYSPGHYREEERYYGLPAKKVRVLFEDSYFRYNDDEVKLSDSFDFEFLREEAVQKMRERIRAEERARAREELYGKQGSRSNYSSPSTSRCSISRTPSQHGAPYARLESLPKQLPAKKAQKKEEKEKKQQQTNICRHFLRGHCRYGDNCRFFHGAPLKYPADQLVFLGGLPHGISSEDLILEFSRRYDIDVLNRPKIIQTYCPRVAVSLENAKRLVDRKNIMLFGKQVDIRRFDDQTKTIDEKCMVFLGGLPEGIKVSELIAQLKKKKIIVVNRPFLGDGYARNVQLQSEAKANDLIRKGKIFLFGRKIDVRPFVNVYAKKEEKQAKQMIDQTEKLKKLEVVEKRIQQKKKMVENELDSKRSYSSYNDSGSSQHSLDYGSRFEENRSLHSRFEDPYGPYDRYVPHDFTSTQV